jgi:tRNA pseudouridine(38-40) synthase
MKLARRLVNIFSVSAFAVLRLVPPTRACLPSSQRHTSWPLSVVSRGRGIPYVETYEEQTTRRLWESEPFSTTKSVVDTVLRDGGSRDKALLVKVETPEHDVCKASGCEYLFSALYKAPPTEISYDNLVAEDPISDKRKHFLLQLAYRGSDFCGWQTQPNNDRLPSVQQTLEEWLQTLEGGKRVDVRVCGRTDAGVHAIGQVARFRSHDKELKPNQVKDHLSKIPLANAGIECINVLPVTKSFHPSFGAKSRAYVYLIDVDDENWNALLDPSKVVTALHTQLQSVQGLELDYIALSYGRLKSQTSICTLYHAQAHLVEEPGESGRRAICIELVGDRFLRRMVRMLVENSLRIAVRQVAPSNNGALLEHLESLDRSRSGKAAPPDGLIFVAATFENASDR